MKGGSSFASKYQPSSVEEECPAAKEEFDKIHYDETTGAFHRLSAATECKIYRSVKRRSRADAADLVFFNSVRGTPWCLDPDDAVREPRIPTQFDVRPASVELPPKIATADHSGPRRVYIRAAVELARYGYTPNCAGCEAADAGVPGFVKPHTEEFHGKKPVTTTEEELDLDDEDDERQQTIYFQHIPTKDAGPIAN